MEGLWSMTESEGLWSMTESGGLGSMTESGGFVEYDRREWRVCGV